MKKRTLGVCTAILVCSLGSSGAAPRQQIVFHTPSTDVGPPVISVYTKNLKPISDDGLYRVQLKCNVPKYSRSTHYPVFYNEVRQITFSIWLSNAPTGLATTPAASSVIAGIPVTAATLSNNPSTFQYLSNQNCDQTFLVSGRTPLYITAVYSDSKTYSPSLLVNLIGALSGQILPLAALFPAGPASVLKTDAGIAPAMATSYSNGLTAYNNAVGWTVQTSDLQAGYYLFSTPHGDGGSVDISIDELASLQSALSNRQVRAAYQGTFLPLSQQITPQALNNSPTLCLTMGKILELTQNYQHLDAVDTLAHVVVLSGLNSNQALTCLSKYFYQVADNQWLINQVRSGQSSLRLSDDMFIDETNPVVYPPTEFGAIVTALNHYAANPADAGATNTFASYFAPTVDLVDTTAEVYTSPTSDSIQNILTKFKAASQQFVYFGCPGQDNVPDADNPTLSDVGYILAIGQSKKLQDVVLMRMWLRYPSATSRVPQVYKIVVGSDSTIETALKNYSNLCFTTTVDVPAQPGQQPGH